FLAPVRRYQDQRDCRWAAQRAVLDQLPKSGSIILIAHSLGSVVAVDLLTKLHPNLRVDLLVTIGSPLAIKPVRQRWYASWRRFAPREHPAADEPWLATRSPLADAADPHSLM